MLFRIVTLAGAIRRGGAIGVEAGTEALSALNLLPKV